MSYKSSKKANALFKKTKRELKPWEKTAQETARKTDRLRALRLAKEAADRETAANDAEATANSGQTKANAKSDT